MFERFLDKASSRYNRRDIEREVIARREVERLQKGGCTTPTVAYPDGEFAVNPSPRDILGKIGRNVEH